MHILCAYTDQKLAQQGQKNSKSVLSALPTFRISDRALLTTWWFIYQRRKVICLMSSPSVHNTIVITIVTIVDNRWLLRQLFLFVPLSCLLPHRLSVSPTFSAEKTFSPSLSRHTVFSTTLSPLAQMRALVGAFIFPALSIPVPFDRSHFETRPPCKIKHPSNFHFCKSDDIIKMYQTGLFIIIFSTKKRTIKENKLGWKNILIETICSWQRNEGAVPCDCDVPGYYR